METDSTNSLRIGIPLIRLKQWLGGVKYTEFIKRVDIKDCVHILGTIPLNDQIQLIRRSMAVIQPSLFEGWSSVVEDNRTLGKTMILSDLSAHYKRAKEFCDIALEAQRVSAKSTLNDYRNSTSYIKNPEKADQVASLANNIQGPEDDTKFHGKVSAEADNLSKEVQNCKAANNFISSCPRISVITPTLNRAKFLQWAINSFVAQDFPPSQYEIIVVENGSTDSTKQDVEAIMAASQSHDIRYVYEPEPGLLSGRHRGAIEAEGDILVFTDDDIEATPLWLSSIANAFEDPNVHLVGGPSLPKFERVPPPWITPYCQINGENLTCGSLSLLDLGDQVQEIDPTYVWGLNFAIRKRTLFELGGFHPDCIPKHLQQFQGDGETGLSIKIREKGYKTFYHPGAMVYHLIPSSRFTVEYFESRFFYQGVCDSYTAIRKIGSTDSIQDQTYNPLDPRIHGNPDPALQENHRRIHKSYIEGFNFHLNAVKKSPKLLEWVLKKDYFDYKLPDV